MGTSLLFHAFGARTFDCWKIDYRQGATRIHMVKKRKDRKCAACGSGNITTECTKTYALRSLPIGQRPTFLVLHLRIQKCHACGAIRQESRDVAEPRKTYTRAFARYAIGLCSEMSIKAAAKHLHVGWDLVKNLLKSHLQRRAKRRSWKKVRRIAIDEIAVRKGHRYMTVVLNLDTGEVLYTARGKDHTCLKAFFSRLKRSGAKLKAIAVDMSAAYRKAIELYAPKRALVIHDRFHVVSNMNKVVKSVFRSEQERLKGEGKKLIKGAMYLLLFAQETLAEKPEKQARLDTILALNEPLNRVYLLKEDLRIFWEQDSKKEARAFINNWVIEARSLKITQLTRMANTIEKRIKNILAWYDYPISTGPLEGTNNKIKVLKRNAYGYRDMDFFGLRVLFIRDTKVQLSGA